MLDLLREKIRTAQDKDVEDKKGTQPKRYYAKDADGDEMSKSTKDKRAAHFAKHGKKDDDDASAYKPAPGDKSAETKPSKYTKQYKKMFGEDAVTDIKAKHADEMERLKARHEREIEALKDRQSRQADTAKSSVDAEKEREKQRKEVDTQSESVDIKRALKKVKGLTKDQLAVLSTMNPSTLTTIMNQLSNLMMGEEDSCWDGYTQKGMKKKGDKMVPNCVPEEIEEGKLVASVYNIIDALTNEFKKRVQKEYDRNPEKGLVMLNRMGALIGAKVSDKMQQKNKLFLKMDMDEERDYKKEYANYHSQPEQIKRRAKRNEARRLMKDNKDIKGKDVHHKDNNPLNNDKKNLSIVSQKYNRTEPRKR